MVGCSGLKIQRFGLSAVDLEISLEQEPCSPAASTSMEICMAMQVLELLEAGVFNMKNRVQP